MKKVLVLALAFAAAQVFAQTSPVGLWKTVYDKSGKEKSLVRIAETNGVLSGKIEKLLDPSVKQDEVCDKCKDSRKDKPVLGLLIIEGVKKSSDTLWEGGQILDPNNGEVYKVRLTPAEGGKKLDVRGYIGMPMLGRTQTWIRVE